MFLKYGHLPARVDKTYSETAYTTDRAVEMIAHLGASKLVFTFILRPLREQRTRPHYLVESVFWSRTQKTLSFYSILSSIGRFIGLFPFPRRNLPVVSTALV
jgi:hypothetical protein